jgi:hypothetical protein
MKYIHCLLAWTLTCTAFAELEIPSPLTPPTEDAPELQPGRPPAAPAGQGTVTLRNDDRLSGRVLRLDRENNVLLVQHKYIREPLAIALDAVQGYQAQLPDAALSQPSAWMLELSNGDRLRGNIVRLDDDTITLDTWYGGVLQVDRAMVASIVQYDLHRILIDGIGGQADWTTAMGVARFHPQSITLSQNTFITREWTPYTPRLRIDFEITWMWQTHMTLRFMGQPPVGQNITGSCYLLSFSGNSRLVLQRMTGDRQSAQLANLTITPRNDENQQFNAHFTVLVDGEAGHVHLYHDGRLLGDWADQAPLDVEGTSLTLVASHSPQLELNSLRVAEWSGRLPTERLPLAADGAVHVFRMQNGDLVSGQLVAIEDDIARVETSFGALNIPTGRIEEIAFQDQTGAPDRHAHDLRLHLQDDTVITLAVSDLADRMVSGSSANFGDIQIPLAGVRTMQWHIDDPQEEPEPAADLNNIDTQNQLRINIR